MDSPRPSKRFEPLALPLWLYCCFRFWLQPQAAPAGSRFIQALRSGILVLVFPPMAICIAIIYAAWRKRNSFRQR